MIKGVATNIITGALGAGKTTLIKQLLSLKPDNERWAILVNEFGEVGIDGAILQNENQTSVFIREVPGGCMCCTSGLPMQIALNQLLAKAKPHRLLIEPTGLGHPIEVLQTLKAPHYKNVVDLQCTLTLIDAKRLQSDKFRDYKVYQDQIKVADVIVLTKSQEYSKDDYSLLSTHLSAIKNAETRTIDLKKQNIDLSILNQASNFDSVPTLDEHSHQSTIESVQETLPPIYKVSNQGQGYFSYGWICSNTHIFDFESVKQVFSELKFERLKAVLQTSKGSYVFNFDLNNQKIEPASYNKDSRIEFICLNKAQADSNAEKIENKLSLLA